MLLHDEDKSFHHIAAGGWSDWSDWSICANREQTRRRSCTNPRPACGGSDCVGSSEERRSCVPGGLVDVIEPTRPTCLPDFNFQSACSDNVYGLRSLGFIGSPCSDQCHIFYKCVPLLDGIHFNVYEQHCNPCTCWSQDKNTCDHDVQGRNPNRSQCRAGTSGAKITQNGGQCYYGDVRRIALVNDATHFIDGTSGAKIECAPGTVFSLGSCGCIHGPNPNLKGPIVDLKFDDVDRLLLNDQGVYVAWGENPDGYGSSTEDGRTSLIFNGKDHLRIPYFDNTELSAFSIQMTFRMDRNSAGDQTLVYLGECRDGGQSSINLRINGNNLMASLGTDTASLMDTFSTQISRSAWHDIVLVYNGSQLKLYVNGSLIGTRGASGIVRRVQCPMLIGSKQGANYFSGLVDRLTIYDRAIQ